MRAKQVNESIKDILTPKTPEEIFKKIDPLIINAEKNLANYHEYDIFLKIVKLTKTLPNDEIFFKLRMITNEWNNHNMSDENFIEQLKHEIELIKSK